MRKIEAIVFDVDGTLYQFSGNEIFPDTAVGRAVRQNIQDFLGNEFGLEPEESSAYYDELNKKYDGLLSLGLERDFGIDRQRFFSVGWDLEPGKLIRHDSMIREVVAAVPARKMVLSGAPRIWIDRVLRHMNVDDLFGERIISGEPDIRKPDPEVFRQASQLVGVEPGCILAVGDQEHTDILPAKHIGMMTARIGAADTATSADIVAPSVVALIETLQSRKLV